jgi:hypothetical protein
MDAKKRRMMQPNPTFFIKDLSPLVKKIKACPPDLKARLFIKMTQGNA